MKPFSLICFIAICLAFACSSCSSFKDSPALNAAKIERLLEADREWRQALSDEWASSAQDGIFSLRARRTPEQLVSTYVAGHKGLDFSRLPAEFQRAYLEHIQAYERLEFELDKTPRNDGAIELLLAFGALHLKPDAAFGLLSTGISKSEGANQQTKKAIDATMNHVIETRHRVEQMALTCGARLNARPPKGFLGVVTQPLTPDFVRKHQLSGTDGALIQQILPGSPAERSAIHEGEVVLALDNQAIIDHHHFRWLLATREPGTKVDLKLRRTASVDTISVVLSAPQ